MRRRRSSCRGVLRRHRGNRTQVGAPLCCIEHGVQIEPCLVAHELLCEGEPAFEMCELALEVGDAGGRV